MKVQATPDEVERIGRSVFDGETYVVVETENLPTIYVHEDHAKSITVDPEEVEIET